MKKILLIEDDSFLSNIYALKLKEKGFEIDVAFSGEEAIEKIEKNKPDIILLDIILPRMSGWDFLQKIRKNEKFDSIKVIVLSNLDGEEEIKKGDKLGVIKHLVKAYYTPNDLAKEIEGILF